MEEWLKPGVVLGVLGFLGGIFGSALGWMWKGFQLKQTADEALRRANAANARVDVIEDQRLPGVLEKISALNREIGEAKSGVGHEQHRIDEHARRGQEQQVKNAEYFAKEAQAQMKLAEALVARLEKAAGERGA